MKSIIKSAVAVSLVTFGLFAAGPALSDARLSISADNLGGKDGETRVNGELRLRFSPDAFSMVVGEAYGNNAASGLKVSYHLLSTQGGMSNAIAGVTKGFLAIDMDRKSNAKATLGFGTEGSMWFWGSYLSHSITGSKLVNENNLERFESRPYDWGVGARVGAFLPDSLVRLSMGADYEWGKQSARQLTGSAMVEKYFPRSPLSVALSGEAWQKREPALGTVAEKSTRDHRVELGVRYELGGAGGSTLPANWQRRAMADNPVNHKRSVGTYTTREAKAAALPGANLPPVTTDDTYTVPGNASNFVMQVLANDRDPNGDTMTITTVSAPPNGTASISGTNILYTPKAGFSGTDTFVYTIADGRGGTATGRVNVTVTAVVTPSPTNRAPVAVNDTATVAANSTNNAIAVLNNDTDPDGDTLTLLSVTAAANGTVGSLGRNAIYTPRAGFAGTDNFTYTVSDGKGGTAVGTVTVTVTPAASTNRPPVAVNDTATVVGNGGPVTINVLANDSDPDGDTLSIASVASPASGTVATQNNQVLYTPRAGFVGVDVFSYVVADGKGGSATGQISVTVSQPNRAPVANNDAATVVSNSLNNLITVLANDTDPDGDALSLVSVGPAANGTSAVAGNQVSYSPRNGFVGTDSFAYLIRDAAGLTATGTVTVTVTSQVTTPVNRAPVAVGDSVTVPGNSSGTLINVLSNDSDPDGDALGLVSVSTPANGTATITGTQVTYVPRTGFVGSDTFTYVIRDVAGLTATGTVNVTVTAPPTTGVNRPPVANADSFTVNRDSSNNELAILANDNDPDGDTLSILAINQPSNGVATVSGGSVRYSPRAGFVGTDTFLYLVSDGKGGTASAVVTITVQ